jgi:3-deoxy-D-manno-oct-2-ulosonic acid (Kdo) hydroxylase
MSRMHVIDLDRWRPAPAEDVAASATSAVEDGCVLYLPNLAFELSERERRFLTPDWSDGRSKNISIDGAADTLKGAAGGAADLADLGAMLQRYARGALDLVAALCPAYAGRVVQARTSYRPFAVTARDVSWRKDDSRLHVDAFPSRPTHGERILRVFSNVNPDGEPRVWRVGEPFEAMARRFLPAIARPLPGAAALLSALGVTKSKRSEYDHLMLHLHDKAKADLDYQATCPQERAPFPSGSTWVVFSDQAMHAAMSGQFMFEQTLHLPLAALVAPEKSPVRVLARLTGRPLLNA